MRILALSSRLPYRLPKRGWRNAANECLANFLEEMPSFKCFCDIYFFFNSPTPIYSNKKNNKEE